MDFKMASNAPDPEWKKGSAELLVLSLLEDQPRHGYDICRSIEVRSGGALRFHVTSLYPLLHRLEADKVIRAKWDKEGGRPRKWYELTAAGHKRLESQARDFRLYVECIRQLLGPVFDQAAPEPA